MIETHNRAHLHAKQARQPQAKASMGWEAAGFDVCLKRHCVACNVIVHGSVGSDVVKRFGMLEAEFPPSGAIAGFKRHFRVLLNGSVAGAG